MKGSVLQKKEVLVLSLAFAIMQMLQKKKKFKWRNCLPLIFAFFNLDYFFPSECNNAINLSIRN